VVNEFNCWYRNRIVGQEKKGRFDQLLAGAVRTQFKSAPPGGLYSFLSGKYVKVKREDYQAVLKGTLIQYEREYQ
jgi:hypothetical protein